MCVCVEREGESRTARRMDILGQNQNQNEIEDHPVSDAKSISMDSQSRRFVKHDVHTRHCQMRIFKPFQFRRPRRRWYLTSYIPPYPTSTHHLPDTLIPSPQACHPVFPSLYPSPPPSHLPSPSSHSPSPPAPAGPQASSSTCAPSISSSAHRRH